MTHSSRQLRLLVLAPFPPRSDAAYGGGRAIAQLVASLATCHRVGLVSLRAEDDPPTDPAIGQACEIVEEVAYRRAIVGRRGVWTRRLRLALGWASGKPMWATDTYAPALGGRLRAIARDWQPDVVQVEFHIMAQYLAWLDGWPAVRVLTDHDPAVDVARSARRTSVLQRLESRVWRRFTRKMLDRVDATVVFTRRDLEALTALAPNARVVRIPLGFGATASDTLAVETDPNMLLFIGSYGHPPNVDAAMHLIHDIFPGVRARHPAARLFLVGADPSPRMRAAASDAVVVTGRVTDVDAYLARAAVVVAPMQLGGGMRVKVLEALAAGKALVASPIALEGVDVVDREHVVVANTDEQFVQALRWLLSDPGARARLGQAARAWARTSLDPDRSMRAYDALYRSLLAERRGEPSEHRQRSESQA